MDILKSKEDKVDEYMSIIREKKKNIEKKLDKKRTNLIDVKMEIEALDQYSASLLASIDGEPEYISVKTELQETQINVEQYRARYKEKKESRSSQPASHQE